VYPGLPSPRARIIRDASVAAAALPAGVSVSRPKSSPSGTAPPRAHVRSFTADPAFQAAAAALAAASERRRTSVHGSAAAKSQSRASSAGAGGGRGAGRSKSSGADTAPAKHVPVAAPLPQWQGPSSATQSVAAAKSL
jgi:hypothetical protein